MKSSKTTKLNKKPGPQSIPLIGNAMGFALNPTEFVLKNMRKYGDVVFFKALNFKFALVSNPNYIKQILQENNTNYTKGTGYAPLRLFLGNGLLTSEGDFWLKQRRLQQPAFSRKNIQEYSNTVLHAVGEMLDRWEGMTNENKTINLSLELIKLTSRITGITLLSFDFENEPDEFWHALSYALKYVNNRTRTNPFNLPANFPTPANIKFSKASENIDKVIYRTIEMRRNKVDEYTDLLSMLMKSRDEKTGEGMTDKQLHDEVLTIFLAGHETSADALMWCIYLLARNPDAEEKILIEVKNVAKNKPISFEDLPQLIYTSQVIEESLRLYPPIWLIGRQTIKEDKLGDYIIPEKTDIMICPYVMHRHPAYWNEPDKFDPERFSPENSKNRLPYSYIPFGGGPRLCIGQNFAMMELLITVAAIIRKFRIKIVSGDNVKLGAYITLRPEKDIIVQLEKRKS
ncbi:MAG: cytochrome P450 [Bacteroidetes bacterium]|nr:cytochrome P450 [Bacteroidota bacterium]